MQSSSGSQTVAVVGPDWVELYEAVTATIKKGAPAS